MRFTAAVVVNGTGAVLWRDLYLPYGDLRHASGTLPTDYGFAGQRLEAGLGLYHMGARWYDARLGRWISADGIVPNPNNPQLFNRYSYAGNSPVLYNDPDGHCGPLCIAGIVALAAIVWFSMEMPVGEGAPPYDPGAMYWHGVETAIKWGGDTPGDVYALIEEWPENRVSNALAIGLVVVPSGAVRAVSKFEDVRHATTSADAVKGILTRIDPGRFDPRARFGRAFYLAQEGATAVAEVRAGGKEATHVIRFHLDIGKAKVLDLTDPTIAKAWGYVHDPAAKDLHQAIAQKALEAGYDVIKFESYQVPGTINYAVLRRFEELLIPQMVSPVP